MTESQHDKVFHPDESEQRSASSLIFQGMTATGALAGGIGTLTAGVAAVTGKFGGGDKKQEQPSKE